MSPDMIVVSCILGVAIFFMVSEKLPLDLTGLGIMVLLMLSGQLAPREAVAGFSNPAPLTVGALFMVSAGLMKTGALNFVTNYAVAWTQGSGKRLLLLSLVVVGVFSAFLNNTPVVVLFISVVLAVCVQYNLAPSKYLIPVSYMSIIAGTSTLIGTSTNILVSDVSTQLGYQPIGMFELSMLGAPLALVGAVLLYFLSPWLLPEHRTATMGGDEEETERKFFSELEVAEDSELTRTPFKEWFRENEPNVNPVEVVHRGHVYYEDEQDRTLDVGDKLILKARGRAVTRMLETGNFVVPTHACGRGACEIEGMKDDPRAGVVVELIVPPGSSLLYSRLKNTPIMFQHGVAVLGIRRGHHQYEFEDAGEIRLSVGDILLVRLPQEELEPIRQSGDFIIAEARYETQVNSAKAPIALLLFMGMVGAASSGMADILTASATAAFLMILTGCLSLKQAYRSVDVKVLLLIIGTIALGTALEKTGASAFYAENFLALFAGAGPHIVLSGFILLTSVLSHFLSNNSTAVLLVPVGISTALAMGVDPRPFIIGIAFGASACYATPIGYQTNLLVYEPGGYSFADYARVGIPMTLLVWIAVSIFIPFIWPF